ncbi:MAG TPA: hypothetical protein VLL77_12570 [Anaerolineales bacterium]|nr:hypothetical protein [Anaerolineales bacterium]
MFRPRDVQTRLEDAQANRRLSRQLRRVERFLETQVGDASRASPVFVFNASTRIQRLSLNAAFGLLASWGLRLAGTPVVQVVCRQATPQCLLGTDRSRLDREPPCSHCTRFSRRLFREDGLAWLDPDSDTPKDHQALASLGFEELVAWEAEGLPIGELVLPSLRWVLRRHDLAPGVEVVRLFRKYLAGAAAMARHFRRMMDAHRPASLVVFNGIMFPEAIARAVFLKAGIPVVTHEVGLRPFSAFFSHTHATFRRIEPDRDRAMTSEEDQRLDAYLAERFNGRFTMAGIRFWPEMKPLPAELQRRLETEGSAILVFTNVVFDTSQIHANTLYPSMFAWLEDLRASIERHPERLFILRSHPDEDRPGKESRQSVRDWVSTSGLERFRNVIFIPPEQGISSYDLFRFARIALVYNSSIGLEASIAGLPVLCAGRARYSEAGAAFLPESREAYVANLEKVLSGDEVPMPANHVENARRFLDFELYRASLGFSTFLEERRGYPGMVELRPFDPIELTRSETLAVVVKGIRDNAPFVLPESRELEAPSMGTL